MRPRTVGRGETIEGLVGGTPRDALYSEWLTSTPLPAGTDLDWGVEPGPPVEPAEEASFAQWTFECLWVRHWLATGDVMAVLTPTGVRALGLPPRAVMKTVQYRKCRDISSFVGGQR